LLPCIALIGAASVPYVQTLMPKSVLGERDLWWFRTKITTLHTGCEMGRRILLTPCCERARLSAAPARAPLAPLYGCGGFQQQLESILHVLHLTVAQYS